jgi:hypothetical protein
MGKIEHQLDRIATALELIAKSISSTQTVLPVETLKSSVEGLLTDSTKSLNFFTHSPLTPEEDLFINTTNIYLDETLRKHAENLKRKSAIKVSQNLIPMQMSFLNSHLPGFSIEVHSGAVLVLSKDDTPKALVRIYTDLGFHRANHWRRDITDITNIASKLNIPKENIFLIVISTLNGLDNNHVCSTLGFNISNKDILDPTNQNILQDYCRLYIKSFSNILPNPEDQIHFLCGFLHPNVVAEDIYSNKNLPIDLKNFQWLSQPLLNIFSYINSI